MQIHLLFSSLLLSCGEKDEETGSPDTTDTSESDDVSSALFSYDCDQNEYVCDLDSVSTTLNTETLATYLDEDGQLSEESCSNLCSEEAGVYYDYLCSCDYTGEDMDGNHPVTCEYTVCAVEGRGHAGIQKLTEVTGSSEMARYFVRAYHAEASSVGAFLQLRAELSHHGAPKKLLDGCIRAAAEEIHHARMMAKLAGEANACLPKLQFGQVPKRSVFELAMDNAVEGCIYESFSALKAQYQSLHATDERILAVMKVIARDETHHAQLAWDIHHFLVAQLSPNEQELIQEAQRKATQKLIEQAVSDSTRTVTGFGTPPVDLAERFARQIIA